MRLRLHTLHRTSYDHSTIVNTQQYKRTCWSCRANTTPFHTFNQDQRRFVIVIVVYLDRKWGWDWHRKLHRTPTKVPSNSSTHQYKRTSCSSMAGMAPLHTKGREAAVAIVAYAFKQLMRAELRRHIYCAGWTPTKAHSNSSTHQYKRTSCSFMTDTMTSLHEDQWRFIIVIAKCVVMYLHNTWRWDYELMHTESLTHSSQYR